METSMRDTVSDILLVGDGETILQDAKARLKELVEKVAGLNPPGIGVPCGRPPCHGMMKVSTRGGALL